MRARAVAGLAVVGAVLAVGCSVIDSVRGSSAPPSPTQLPVPSGAQALSRFYTQELSWSACDGGQCAELTVPLDYSAPDDASISIAVLRVPATSQRQRIGSLVVNPGGPGGSGVDYAAAADFIVGAPVRQRYDIVGFDPRGVARSEPIDCLSDAELDAWLGSDPSPDDAAEREAFVAASKAFAESCEKTAGPILRHVSTRDAAADMDILRAALGERTLTYLGKSYGTYLGAVYAGMFPDRVGRFVLDGAIAPELTTEQVNAGQAAGFERATRAWAQDCVEGGTCTLGRSVDEVVTGLQSLLRGLDEGTTRPVVNDPRVKVLSEGWASYGIAAAMYDQGMWSTLNDALTDVLKGDGDGLFGLALRYADRDGSGQYTGNIQEAIYAVNCLDKPDTADIAEHLAQQERASAQSPTWAPFLMWSSIPCAFWPDRPTQAPAPIAAKGAAPIVVIGTTRDPATPYEWAVSLAKELESGTLVTFDGDGHTAYTRSNSCVDNAIDAYYVDGTVPPAGLTC